MTAKKTSKQQKNGFSKTLTWVGGGLIIVGVLATLFLVFTKTHLVTPTKTPASNSRHLPKSTSNQPAASPAKTPTSSSWTPASSSPNQSSATPSRTPTSSSWGPTSSSSNQPPAQTSPTPSTSTPPTTNNPTPSASTSSNDWHLTVYYTAVESYHHGTPVTITGCRTRDCANGSDNLGTYPSDFADKIKNEGSGRITSAPNSGKYLNWSYDTGYWLDTIPADSHGNPLQPYISAAADDNVLAQGSNFKVTDCGTSQIDPDVCQHLKQGNWTIVDHFTPGLGGTKHIDLYIGEEDQDNFEASNKFVDLSAATIQIGS